jgi:hypothetical protein
MDKNRQALIAINEAISALDKVPPESSAADLIDMAHEWLLESRRDLGAPEFPELPNIHNFPVAESLWFAKHEADQKADGRL